MIVTEPKVEQRPEQPYVAIRTLASMNELSTVIPQLTDEVFSWLEKHGIASTGPSIVRYHVIDMAGKLDLDIGVLVASPVAGDARVSAGVLPAGRYAALVYSNVEEGVPGNAALLGWGAKQGLVWDQWDTAKGDAFGARYETLLTNPDEEPDLTKWETEVAIRLAD
jgi:hypothetical protein